MFFYFFFLFYFIFLSFVFSERQLLDSGDTVAKERVANCQDRSASVIGAKGLLGRANCEKKKKKKKKVSGDARPLCLLAPGPEPRLLISRSLGVLVPVVRLQGYHGTF